MSNDDDAARRARNQATAQAMFVAFSSNDPEGLLAHCASDIAYEAPYYPEMGVRVGVDALAAMLDAVEERFTSIDYRVTGFIPALDPDLVIAEVRGDHAVKDTDRRYQNHYLMFMEFRDAKVVRWREFSDPLEYRRAVTGSR
jgi:ketosteroid isomerase-like protein